jgi:TonB-linked SusC/RagA family outer membrane protein
MMKKTPLLCLFFLACSFLAFAQERTITGKISEEANKSSIAGATITVKGGKKTVTADANGAFSIAVPPGKATLIISSIGFATKEVPLGAEDRTVDVLLSTDNKQLGEVIVTALGITRQSKTLVYATQSIATNQLNEVRATDNFLGSLSGKVANVQINQGSGGLGSGAKIVLRGNKSIQGSNNALIVVDGVPVLNPTYSTAGNDFGSLQSSDGASDINPDDIESVTVLRGASAAALYGSQAGNGVMVITTKKGKKGHYEVTTNSGIGFDKPFALPDFQNSYGQGIGGKLADSSQQGASWGPKMTGQSYTDYLYKKNTLTPQPDNVKDFFRTGLTVNNSVGVSAGSDKMQSYFSYTNNYAKGIIRSNDLNRHTFNFRIANQISSKLSSDVKINYSTVNINGRPRTGEENSQVFDAYEMPRSMKTSDALQYQKPNTFTVMTPTNWPSTNNSIYQNPYWMLNNTQVNTSRTRVIGFASLKYQITPWLSARGSANLDKISDQIEEKYQQGTLLWNTNAGGSYGVTTPTWTQKWFDFILEGSNSLGHDLKLGYHAGVIRQDNLANVTIASSNGLFVANKFSLNYASNPSTTQDGYEIITNAVFGQANLSWKDAIFIDGSYRRDWSSPLPPPYHYSYPSIGASVLISELIKELPLKLSFLKLSANFAQVGNGGQFGVTNSAYNYVQGAGNGGIARSTTLNIPGLKPEIVKSYELGLEAHFLNDRVGFTATWYKSNSTNQLLNLNLPVATGYATQYINAGNIENHGWEFVINASPIKTSSFTWDLAVNLSLNRNKIITLSPDLKETNLGGGDNRSALPDVKEGGSYGDLYAFQWLKNAKGQFLVNANGTPYTSYTSGDPIGYIGNFNPKEIVGMTNTFQYKRFNLRFLIDGKLGGILVSGTEMNLAFSGITKATDQYREGGWNLGGVSTTGAAVTTTTNAQAFWQTASGQRYGVGEFFAYSASNIRLRELSLGYDIPLHKITVIKSLRFSAVARNLFWIYRGSSILSIPGLGKRKMWMDPDMSNGNGNFQGTEYGAMPSTRTLGFNLKASF